MTKEALALYMKKLSDHFGTTSLWLPVAVRHLLLRAPVDVRKSCIKQWLILSATSPLLTEEKAHNDVFPLELSLSEEDLQWDDVAADPAQLTVNCPLHVVKSARSYDQFTHF